MAEGGVQDLAMPMAPTLKDFVPLKNLGDGRFGEVMLVKKNTGMDIGKLYAMKVIEKDKVEESTEGRTHLMSERFCMIHVKHTFVIQLKYAFQDERRLFFVMENAPGGDLDARMSEHIVPYEETEAKFYTQEITLGLKYLHDMGIAYRDLKPENILLDAMGHVKLADFGFSKQNMWQHTKTSTFCGTMHYLAPEIVRWRQSVEGKLYGSYTRAVDYWSLGVIVFEMLVGEVPFAPESGSYPEIAAKIKEGSPKFPKTMTTVAKDFIKRLLEILPSHRLGVKGCVKAHKFFQGTNWDDVLRRKIPVPFVPNSLIPGQNDAEETQRYAAESTDNNANSSAANGTERTHFEGFDFVSEDL